jgi:N,N'-diacetylbacillosaminyl-diphospho-undecaprenol alpha-1,3-N-acetylgalactosaminyltransferase
VKFGFLSHLDLNLWLFRLPVMQELIRRGHEVYAIVPEGEVSCGFEKHGIVHVPYAITRSSLNPLKEIKAIKAIYEAISPLELDVLHTFTAKPNIYGTIAGTMAKVPRIINLVEGLGSFYLENDLKSRVVRSLIEILYKQTFKLSHRVMFVNNDDPAYLIDKKIIAPDKVFTINGVGIDTHEWQPVKSSKDEVRVTMIARAVKHKGVHEFIAAATILKPRFPEVVFEFVGAPDGGNIFSVTEEFMRSCEAIEYRGHQSDIKTILAQSSVFVLPSYREGLPRTSMEAMSMALPVVTTDAVGCRETVDEGENGFVVPVGDAKALAHAIEKLLLSPDLRAAMGKKGREKAVNLFDLKAIVKEHMRVYSLTRS